MEAESTWELIRSSLILVRIGAKLWPKWPGKRLKDISTPDFSTPSFNPGPFNPRLFNHEFFNPGHFNHEFFNHGVEKFRVEMSFNLLERWHFKPRLFNHELFNHELFNPMIQIFIVEKSGVEKFMVEKSGVEAWGWDVLQPGKRNTKLCFVTIYPCLFVIQVLMLSYP